jgi:hypothetical protein
MWVGEWIEKIGNNYKLRAITAVGFEEYGLV